MTGAHGLIILQFLEQKHTEEKGVAEWIRVVSSKRERATITMKGKKFSAFGIKDTFPLSNLELFWAFN